MVMVAGGPGVLIGAQNYKQMEYVSFVWVAVQPSMVTSLPPSTNTDWTISLSGDVLAQLTSYPAPMLVGGVS